MSLRHLITGTLLTLSIINSIITDVANAQVPWFTGIRRGRKQSPFQKLFLYKTFVKPTDKVDSVEFILYTKIANDLLQFVRKDTVYLAQYELTIIIKNPQGETVIGEIKKQRVKTTHFQQTNARNLFTHEKFSFLLTPAKYDLFIEILDLETKTPIRQKETIHLPKYFSGAYKPSQILFYHSKSRDTIDHKDDFPTFPPVCAPTDSSFWASFMVGMSKPPLSIKVQCSILDYNNKWIRSDSLTIVLNKKISPVLIPLDTGLDFGQYTLRVKISDSKTDTVLTSPFYVRWQTHTTFIPSLTEAIEVLRHVMEHQQWKQLRQQPRDKQKMGLEEFWKKRDPDPDTEVNELEEEYYKRVTFANQHFFSWHGEMDGWKTDRGLTYIIYGQPSDVENPSTQSGGTTNYEIWYYRNLQKRFVFLDKDGTGDYRLVSEE